MWASTWHTSIEEPLKECEKRNNLDETNVWEVSAIDMTIHTNKKILLCMKQPIK